jgi:NAD(P)H-hydrate epimerase
MFVAIPVPSSDIPELSTSQMVEVDRLMIEQFRIELIQMMENAGRNLAHLAQVRFLNGDPRGKNVVVAAGTGGNGGGALVCARRLANWGADVCVALARESETFKGVTGDQLDILRRMHVPTVQAGELTTGVASASPDLIIDGVIGYSLSGAPRGGAAQLIVWANKQGAPVLSLDAPSGLDSTSGIAFEPAIKATATLTLALPKRGLRMPDSVSHVGELYLADISVPPSLYAASGIGVKVEHIFATSEIVRLA